MVFSIHVQNDVDSWIVDIHNGKTEDSELFESYMGIEADSPSEALHEAFKELAGNARYFKDIINIEGFFIEDENGSTYDLDESSVPGFDIKALIHD